MLAVACASGTPAPTPEPSAPVDAGPATREALQLTTSDGLTLDAFVLRGGAEGAPGILLLHQFQQSLAQWDAFPETLAERGYVVVALSYRGHGASDPYPRPLTDLLTDPAGAPLDVDAGLAALVDHGADAERIGVVGTSIGANLTVAAAILNRGKTYVSLSSRIPPAEALAGQSATALQSVFYLAAENDSGGQAADARTLFGRTSPPADLLVARVAAHGIALLRDVPEVEPRILTWLDDTLMRE